MFKSFRGSYQATKWWVDYYKYKPAWISSALSALTIGILLNVLVSFGIGLAQGHARVISLLAVPAALLLLFLVALVEGRRLRSASLEPLRQRLVDAYTKALGESAFGIS